MFEYTVYQDASWTVGGDYPTGGGLFRGAGPASTEARQDMVPN